MRFVVRLPYLFHPLSKSGALYGCHGRFGFWDEHQCRITSDAQFIQSILTPKTKSLSWTRVPQVMADAGAECGSGGDEIKDGAAMWRIILFHVSGEQIFHHVKIILGI